jgi:hypothetical protein
MSSAVATLKPRPRTVHLHYRWVGFTKMWCIQPNCDGHHHFYCSCR